MLEVAVERYAKKAGLLEDWRIQERRTDVLLVSSCLPFVSRNQQKDEPPVDQIA